MSQTVTTNAYGDQEISDPRAMRALAHPVRLAILDRLQADGPATASQLAPYVGATATVTSWHLRHLAGFGLVRDAAPGGDRRTRRWEAAASGYRFQSGPRSVGAARALTRAIFHRDAGLPSEWLAHEEPHLEARWRRHAGLSNTTITVTAEELGRIEDAIEQVLAPYVTRSAGDRPRGARRVRLLRYVLPFGPARRDSRAS